MSDKPLSGRLAWVTGSSRGIGRAIAEHLAGMGADLVIHGTSPTSCNVFGEAASLQDIADDIAREHGVRVLPVCGDLTDYAVVERLVAKIAEEAAALDILVNCAGGDIGSAGTSGPEGGRPQGNNALDISLDDIRAVLDRNLLTCIYCCRVVAPQMMERKRGWIVNLGSIAGLGGTSTGSIYACAKAAVHEYTRCLALQLREYGIHVNAVAPGGILSARFMASRTIDEQRMHREGSLDRYGWPDEIASAVGFMVSDGASYLSGQVLRVDGATQTWPA